MMEAQETGDLWSFLNSIPNVVLWQTDQEGRLTYVSEGVESLIGVEPSGVTKEPQLWTERIFSRHRLRYQKALSKLLETGSAVDIEYRARLPGIRSAWLRDHLTFDPASRLVYGVTTRIDDQRDTEQRLGFLNKAGKILSSSLNTREVLRRLADLIVGSLADICVIEVQEQDEVIVVVRAQGDRSLARALESAGPMFLARRRWPSRFKKGRAVLYAGLTRKQLASITGVKHGRLLAGRGCHAAILAPLSIRGRTLGAVTLLCTDPDKSYQTKDLELATEVCRQAATALDHARLFAQAETARATLARENEMKDEFLGIMSHELRTPLTVIYGVSRMLPRMITNLDEDSQGLVDDLYTASEKTIRLVEDLMLLARLNLGDAPEVESLDVQSLLEDVAQDFGRQRTDRALISDDVQNFRVRGAPAFLRQILLNLLSNAEKYTPAGAPIRIGAENKGDAVVLYVQDAGPGLPEEELENIFDRFYRSANAQGISGSGLGLAICRRLCEAQGGEITAENGAEGGLRVNLNLPAG